MLFKINEKIIFMYKKNLNKTLTKTLLQFKEFSSGVFAIDFEQVNIPWELISATTIRHFNAQK